MRLHKKCKTSKNLSMKIIYSANWETTASAGFWWREMSVQSAWSVAVVGGGSHPRFVKSHKRFCGRLEPQSKNIYRSGKCVEQKFSWKRTHTVRFCGVRDNSTERILMLLAVGLVHRSVFLLGHLPCSVGKFQLLSFFNPLGTNIIPNYSKTFSLYRAVNRLILG